MQSKLRANYAPAAIGKDNERNAKELAHRRLWAFDYDGVMVPAPTRDDIKGFLRESYQLISKIDNVPMNKAREIYVQLRDENPNLATCSALIVHKHYPHMNIEAICSHILDSSKYVHMHNGHAHEIGPQLRGLQYLGIQNVIITNNSAQHVRRVLQQSGVAHCFDKIVGVEHMGGTCKPEKGSYRITMDLFNAAPRDTILIDDSVQNIAAASDLGIFTVHINGESREQCREADMSFPDIKNFLRWHNENVILPA